MLYGYDVKFDLQCLPRERGSVLLAQQWYVKIGKQVRGPVSAKKLKALADSGKLPANSLLSLDQKKWVKPTQIKGLGFKRVENTAYAPPPVAKRSTSHEIQQAGIKDRFSPLDNPFAVLGLSADTSGKKIHEHAQRLRIRLKFDNTISDEFVSRVELACEKLNDPVTRYYCGAFWVTLNAEEEKEWNEHPVLSRLAEGWNTQAIAAYESIASNQSLAIRSHNKAVLELGNALALTEVESVKLKSAWQQAFKSWMLLAQSAAFTEMIKQRAEELDDPRLSETQIRQWQTSIPEYLMQYCSLRATASLIAHNIEEACLWVDCIRESVFSEVVKNKVLETVYERFTLAIEHAIDQWKAKLTDEPDEKLLDKIANGMNREVLPKIVLILKLGDLPGRAEEAARDRCAEFLRRLSMAYNHIDRNDKAVKIIEKAKKVADATALTNKLEEDSIQIRTISITSVAYELCQKEDYPGAISYLDDCLDDKELEYEVRKEIRECRDSIADQYAITLTNQVIESINLIDFESRFQVDNGKSLLRDLDKAKKRLDKASGYATDQDTDSWVQTQKFKIGEHISQVTVLKHDHQPSSCFVATATFGDPSNDTVVSLRGYRDLVLSRSLLGKLFIQLYYQIGPYLARCVKRWPKTRLILRPIFRWVAQQLTQTKSFQAAERARESGL